MAIAKEWRRGNNGKWELGGHVAKCDECGEQSPVIGPSRFGDDFAIACCVAWLEDHRENGDCQQLALGSS